MNPEIQQKLLQAGKIAAQVRREEQLNLQNRELRIFKSWITAKNVLNN